MFIRLLLIFTILYVVVSSLLIGLCACCGPLNFSVAGICGIGVNGVDPRVPKCIPSSLLAAASKRSLIHLISGVHQTPRISRVYLTVGSYPCA